ncbi:MAG: aldo/keto reductase, partial [Anaerolineae bacterium]|nr:aldo/keto reductase [Anaerolineae bacterium]
VLEEAERIAAEHAVPVAQVALAWQLSLPGMTSPIVGARTVTQLMELVGAVDVALSPGDIERLNTVSDGY